MKIPFTQVVWSEDWDFHRIVREAGLSQAYAEELIEKVWDGGTRELILRCEIDLDTGVITVVGQETS